MSEQITCDLGWQLDHLMALDTSGKGAVPPMYRAAADRWNEPLSLRAARLLLDSVIPGSVVGILTGFPSRSFLLEGVTETDGPVGAAVLARVVEEVLGAIPVLITERRVARYLHACATSAGLLVADLPQALRSKTGPHTAACAAVLPFPTDRDEAKAAASELLDHLEPSALIAVEQPGFGFDEQARTAAGRPITDHLLAKMDYLFDEAERRGILRIGIGDNGNELGMGSIAGAVRAHAWAGRDICARSTADALLVAGNSNWGAYALAAAVEALKNRQAHVLQRIDIAAIHRRCSEEGAIDGISQRPEPRSDGTSIDLNRAVIALMAWQIERVADRIVPGAQRAQL